MICKRLPPRPELSSFVKEYVLLHAIFDSDAEIPPKSYPVNPEEGMTFVVRGKLVSENPLTNFREERPAVTLFGLPGHRQNLYISREYLMLHVRFQPGALFRLLGIPMTELFHTYLDARLVFGSDIDFLLERLAEAVHYDAMPVVLDDYFLAKSAGIKTYEHPVDKIAENILKAPQHFSLEKSASDACLSFRQFEKRFTQQIGVAPKYFSRICRFYQAYDLKERKPLLDWLSVAIHSGYNDYQHMVKDFKQFAGTTPKALLDQCQDNPERRLNIAVNFIGL